MVFVEVKEKKRQGMNTAAGRLLSHFMESFKKKIGYQYVPSYARDMKMLKDMLNGLGLSDEEAEKEVEKRIDKYFLQRRSDLCLTSFRYSFNRMAEKQDETPNWIKCPRFDANGTLIEERG